MKIALISSAMDSLALFKFLHRYDYEFLIYFDSLNAPYGEKSLKVWLSAAKAWILRAKEQAADAVILPPVLEQMRKEVWFYLFFLIIYEIKFSHIR